MTYKQAFYQKYNYEMYYPRAMFKDETNYFAAFNRDDYLIYR
jgi:hypothetical protein